MSERPNVLFVLADQMRASAMGCAGTEQVRTPALDGAAEAGARFSAAYTPSPGCCPARGSVFTGRYPHQHGVVNFNVPLPATADTLGCRLREAGYATGYVGKWHLDGRDAPGYVPPERRQGFEYWRGFNRGHRYHDGHPHPNPDGSVDWEEGYQPAVQTDMAIDFLDEQAGAEDPFFLTLSWGPPHTPFEAPAEYSAMYDPDELSLRPNVPDAEDTPELRADLAEYYALVTSLDDQLARLLACLDERGIAEDTLVVFTADHGEQLGSQGRYRKGYPFEESVGVPLVVRYPRAVEGGRTLDCPVTLLDLMPTILSYADAPLPPTLEGESLVELLGGESTVPHPDGVYIQHDLPFDSAWRALRTERYVLVVDRDLRVRCLFDLERDPYQRENLAGRDEVTDLEGSLFESFIDAAERHADSTIWSRWYVRDVLDNSLDAPTMFGSYEELPGEPPHYE